MLKLVLGAFLSLAWFEDYPTSVLSSPASWESWGDVNMFELSYLMTGDLVPALMPPGFPLNPGCHLHVRQAT